MSETIESLRRKIDGAGDLGSVVRTMKALAAANIGQYERALLSLADYYRAVQWGLGACVAAADAAGTAWRGMGAMADGGQGTDRGATKGKRGIRMGMIVFGSDQGLVGQFNQVVADFAVRYAGTDHSDTTIWAVGERVESHLADAGLPPDHLFPVPGSVQAITQLITRLLTEVERQMKSGSMAQVILCFNRPLSGAQYEPVSQCILPIDNVLTKGTSFHWPSGNPPEVFNEVADTLQALIGEYLFVSLFKACAESLASENASRLAAMQGAEKNIKELLEGLSLSYHRLRQNSIDAELFDVIAGATLTTIIPGPDGSQE